MTDRPRSVPTEQIRRDASGLTGVGDEALCEAFASARISYEAEGAALSLLALACHISHYRPHLFSHLIQEPIDAMVCMGVGSTEVLWKYVSYLRELDAEREESAREFSVEALQFATEEMSGRTEVVERALAERLA